MKLGVIHVLPTFRVTEIISKTSRFLEDTQFPGGTLNIQLAYV